MAKGVKKDAGASGSVLQAAFDAHERGDVVTARALLKAAQAGQTGPQDEAAAKRLAKTLSVEGQPVGDTTAEVAQALLTRLSVPRNALYMAAFVLTVYVLLVVMYLTRY